MERKENGKELVIFLVICLPVTWLLVWGARKMDSGYVKPTSQLLYELACFLPMITAVLLTVGRRKPLRSLGILPKLQENAKWYFAAIGFGVLLSLLDTPLAALCFPKVESFEGFEPAKFVFLVLIYTMLAIVQFWILMGEEVGWMGYVYPRLEQKCGMIGGIILLGVIRGGWHLAMLWQSDIPKMLCNLLFLILSNIFLGSVLVLVTKKTGSVIPAALIHALTNAVPSVYANFLCVDEAAYASRQVEIGLVSMIPVVLIGGVALGMAISDRR